MTIRFMLSLTLGLAAGGAMAQDSITLGMVLEPPNLDPTANAAAARAPAPVR